MHRKHVINTLKKHLGSNFTKGWEMPTSFSLYSPTTPRQNRAHVVWGVYVGLLKFEVQLSSGGIVSTFCRNLDSLEIKNDSIVINDSITIPLKGTLCQII